MMHSVAEKEKVSGMSADGPAADVAAGTAAGSAVAVAVGSNIAVLGARRRAAANNTVVGCVGIIDASPGVADSDGSQQTMAPEDAQLANLSYQK